MSDANLELRPCPHCAEPIRREARVCRYCGRDSVNRFEHLPSYQAGIRAHQPFKWMKGHTIVTAVVAIGVAAIVGLGLYAQRPCPPPPPGAELAAAKPRAFDEECAVALVNAQKETDQLDSAHLAPIDPVIIQSGYPTRVQCRTERWDHQGQWRSYICVLLPRCHEGRLRARYGGRDVRPRGLRQPGRARRPRKVARQESIRYRLRTAGRRAPNSRTSKLSPRSSAANEHSPTEDVASTPRKYREATVHVEIARRYQ